MHIATYETGIYGQLIINSNQYGDEARTISFTEILFDDAAKTVVHSSKTRDMDMKTFREISDDLSEKLKELFG